jgi:diacylglycerol kinase (ATP)
MSARRMAVIINPMAGAGAGSDTGRQVVSELEKAGIKVEQQRSTAAGDAILQARAVVRDTYDAVISVGGDGTLHEVVNGLLSADRTSAPLPAVGLVPVGTGNDYIKMHGGPMSPQSAIRQIIEGRRKAVDIGVIKDGTREAQYFINNVGGGFLAQGVVYTERTHKKKGRRGGGKLRYVVGGLKALVHHEPVSVSVHIGDELFEGPFAFVYVGIGRFCGGGINFIPGARVDDGDLSVLLVRAHSKLRLLSMWPFLERGGLSKSPSVIRRSCSQLRLTGQPMLIHSDGELYQIQSSDCSVQVLPSHLEVLA